MSTDETKEEVNGIAIVPPSKTVSDILVDPAEISAKTPTNLSNDIVNLGRVMGGNQSMPSLIVTDWMYLGNRTHSGNIHIAKGLGITHILNVTKDEPCFHIFNDKINIKYARISLIDISNLKSSPIYDYFEAAAEFIDECNPNYNELTNNKILIHCAADADLRPSLYHI